MNYSMQKQKLGKSHSMYFPRGIKHVNERHYYTVTSLKRLSLFFIHKDIMEPAEPVHTGESQGFLKEGNMWKPRLKAEKKSWFSESGNPWNLRTLTEEGQSPICRIFNDLF